MDHVIGSKWTMVERHVSIPVSGDRIIDGIMEQYISAFGSISGDDAIVTLNGWHTVEDLCRGIILRFGKDLDSYDFSTPYPVTDIVLQS